MKKSKLFARFRHGHLIPKIGFRVDLQESGEEFGKMDESICFEILEADENKLKVRLFHIIYDDNVGRHEEESWGLYKIDLNKSYNEHNIKYLGKEKF